MPKIINLNCGLNCIGWLYNFLAVIESPDTKLLTNDSANGLSISVSELKAKRTPIKSAISGEALPADLLESVKVSAEIALA